MRPAFDEKDREPADPAGDARASRRGCGKLNPEVPRDLETIVHKAIEQGPGPPLRDGGRAGRRPAAVPRRRADPGAAIVASGAAWSLVPAQPTGGLPGRGTGPDARGGERRLGAGRGSLQPAGSQCDEAAASERRSRLEAEALRKQSDANFAGTRRGQCVIHDGQREPSPQGSGAPAAKRELLQSALRFYQEFLQERVNDPKLRAELAATYLRIGQINADLGREAESRQALLSAISTYDAERRRQPGNIEIEDRLGDAWATLGDLDFEIGKRRNSPIEKLRKERMFKSYQQAVTLREAVARRQPESLLYAKKLATAVNRLGFAQSWLGLTRRISNLSAAVRRFGSIWPVAHPKTPEIQYGLGESLMNLALRLPTLGQLEEALTLLRGAQAHYRVACASCLTSSSMASTSELAT